MHRAIHEMHIKVLIEYTDRALYAAQGKFFKITHFWYPLNMANYGQIPNFKLPNEAS